MQLVTKAYFILYVADQTRSTEFYSLVLGKPPRLNVPGMSEFELSQDAVLGLMPEDGASRLFGAVVAHPSLARGAPRAELYLMVDEPAVFHSRAIAVGGKELSALSERDWGHTAAYVLDPDGHVIAFACST